jgi:hypothetical protein
VQPAKLARYVKLYGRQEAEQWYGSRERNQLEEATKRLRAQGLIPAAIADRLGVSDRRAKALLRAA